MSRKIRLATAKIAKQRAIANCDDPRHDKRRFQDRHSCRNRTVGEETPSPIPPGSPKNRDTPQGLGFAVSAYFLWGFLPIYLKWASHIPPAEVVSHRIVRSVPIADIIPIVLGRTRNLRAAPTNPKTLAMGALTATPISIDWGIYVWAISVEQTMDAALGYFIDPLFDILLGAALLGEGSPGIQLVAIGLASLAVPILIFFVGRLPWAAFGLTLSWGFYALAKSNCRLDRPRVHA